MFADVVLHRRIPAHFESFTYRVPTGMQIREGELVVVPFRTKKLAGIVRKLHATAPPYTTRELEKLPTKPPALPAWQLKLAAWMSEYYKTPYSKVINLFIPKRIWPKK